MLQPYINHIIRNKKRYIVIVLLVICIGVIRFFYSAPQNFPIGNPIIIESGENAINISKNFKEKGIVRSTILLNNLIIFLGGERTIVSGEYLFDRPLNVFEVAKRITNGKFGVLPRKITIPEGLSAREISDIFSTKYINFDTKSFLDLALPKEGYLFPDTYYFMSNVKNEEIISKMSQNFDDRIAEIIDEINSFEKPLNDIIIMASILEEEARLTETRQIVAGILWKRLELGMPLQVDGTFKYINGKGSADLTMDDLKIDSPYNTYVYKGLPPTPVSNPGIDAIKAAITPIKTNYLYFLTDNDGNMHYARTLEEHVANKKKYLQ